MLKCAFTNEMVARTLATAENEVEKRILEEDFMGVSCELRTGLTSWGMRLERRV